MDGGLGGWDIGDPGGRGGHLQAGGPRALPRQPGKQVLHSPGGCGRGRTIAPRAGTRCGGPAQPLGRGQARHTQVPGADSKPWHQKEEGGGLDLPARTLQLGAPSPGPRKDAAAARKPGRRPRVKPSRRSMPGRRGRARSPTSPIWGAVGPGSIALAPGAGTRRQVRGGPPPSSHQPSPGRRTLKTPCRAPSFLPSPSPRCQSGQAARRGGLRGRRAGRLAFQGRPDVACLCRGHAPATQSVLWICHLQAARVSGDCRCLGPSNNSFRARRCTPNLFSRSS